MAVSVTAEELAGLVTRLRAGGSVFAEEEVDLLVAEARTPDQLSAMTADRAAGRPLEQVLGWAEFCGLRIFVAPGVFVPRRRTQLLAERAIDEVLDRIHGEPPPVVLDLCCGTGAIGAAVLATAPTVELFAADIDPIAVRCARGNLAAGATVLEGDLFRPLPGRLHGRIDVLLVNAPYVPTDAIALMPPEARVHEASTALDGGPDGLYVLMRVVAEAPKWLRPDGVLLIESSAAQVPALTAAMAASGLSTRVERSDEVGGTVVIGERRSRS
ncbi:MAG: putative protein N(5)-glutamine methyltransferase [Nocardioidaceae bacterium]